MRSPSLEHDPGPAPSTVAVRPGMRLGRYEILDRLGSGGMADVWIGRATGLGAFERRIAIKTVHPELARDPRQRELFVREARLAATIRHANVVDLFDFGEADGILYQVMSLVEGSDLSSLARRLGEPLPPVVLSTIVGDALRGLHAAHESVDEQGRPRGLVHRDVSPQNILVGLDGVSRVSDFGIAVEFEHDDEVTGTLRGKFGYFAPERLERVVIDRRSDVFAMGIVLWEGLAGKRLFRARTAIEVIANVRSMPIVDPREHRPDAPAALCAVALSALERDLERRTPSAEAMGVALADACRADGIVPSVDAVAKLVERLFGAEVRERIRRATAPAAPPRAPKEGTVSYVPAHEDHRTEVMLEPPVADSTELLHTVSKPATTGATPPEASPPRGARWMGPALLGGGLVAAAIAVAAFRVTGRDDGRSSIANVANGPSVTVTTSIASEPSSAPAPTTLPSVLASASATLRPTSPPPPRTNARPTATARSTATASGHALPFNQNPFNH